MNPTEVNKMGMILEEWKVGGCIAHFGVGNKWATLYDIKSTNPNKGEATKLLELAKEHYKDKEVGSSVALNDKMSHILKKLNIKEYN